MNFDLSRYHEAQKNVYRNALEEIRSGKKKSHWMWFIFPQLKGLGRSSTANYYGIQNEEEARAYLNDVVLGRRLIEISRAMLEVNGKDANHILGSPDDLKLRSSMTLFSLLRDTDPVFQHVLDKYFAGKKDPMTIALLTEKSFLKKNLRRDRKNS